MFATKSKLEKLEKRLVDYVYETRNELFHKLEEFSFFIKGNYVTHHEFHTATESYSGLKNVNDAQSMELAEMKQKIEVQDLLINNLIKENEKAKKETEEQKKLNEGIVRAMERMNTDISKLSSDTVLLNKYVEGANELSMITLHTLTEVVPEEVEQGKLNYIKNTRRN